MSFMDDLEALRTYIDSIVPAVDAEYTAPLKRVEFSTMYDLLWNTLADLVVAIDDMVLDGKPYPPDKLTTIVVVSGEVIDTGDGSMGPYSGTFAHFPLVYDLSGNRRPKMTIHATSGALTLNVTDDGIGNLVGDVSPILPIIGEVIDVGDGTMGNYSGTLLNFPLSGGFVHITAPSGPDTLVVTDDRFGGLIGDVAEIIPVIDEIIAVGDGTQGEYTGALAGTPIAGESIVITAQKVGGGTLTVRDNGGNQFYGDVSPVTPINDEVIETGNGSTGPYSGILAVHPFNLGSLHITAEHGGVIMNAYDDEHGNIVGDIDLSSPVPDEVIGVGTGATGPYTGTLINTPARPGSIVITATSGLITLTVYDDGLGNLYGDIGAGVNTIDYALGNFNVTFSLAVDVGSNILCSYRIPAVNTINYTTGEFHVTFTNTVDAATDVLGFYNMDAHNSINYTTGAFKVTFSYPVVDTTNILATYGEPAANFITYANGDWSVAFSQPVDNMANIVCDYGLPAPNAIDYATGNWSVEFSLPVDNLSNITADYQYYDVTNVRVVLYWEPGLGNVDGHRVFRQLPPAPYAQIGADLGPTANTYTDGTVVGGNTYNYKVQAFNNVGKPVTKQAEWRMDTFLAQAFPGDIIVSIADTILTLTLGNGKVTKAGFYLENTGTDVANPLELEMDVKIGATSIFSTLPKITKDAADASSSFWTGAGITVGVLDGVNSFFSEADILNIVFTLTRTPAPGDELAGAIAYMEYQEGDPTESDDSNELTVDVPV